ncbi:hypothetical protein IDH44_22105 [Paenibacillus sp. IB182496]|uniref:Membrane protein YkvI n=1 Tax=Paenibacillus sabuli TaxID=2772509 RepID=A0A927BYZ8_9BACL|nr:hypothetical protein [Paenibacillus sabuli]MBD2847898.1 hypothetical protein [Paenibacillus sabuli]
MRRLGLALQIALTYIGTIVGAGFASGREILQFFTRFGAVAALTIVLAAALFAWLGAKMMLLAREIGAQSYEDLNMALFGPRFGKLVSYFMMLVLLGVTGVMLAGAGSVFSEHLNASYQLGLAVTLLACFLLLRKGMHAILLVNTVVVPIMLLFTLLVMWHTTRAPGADRWLELTNDYSPWTLWLSPLLYTAFNLTLAQAVLVPLGARIQDRGAIRLGALLGGIGIGFMLLVGHIALSANMPGISQFAIPMGGIARQLGMVAQWIYIFLIYSEIFTTLIADVYGLSLQVRSRFNWPRDLLILAILGVSFLLSQIGFGTLLSTLYPIFGFVSLGWLALMIRRSARSRHRTP